MKTMGWICVAAMLAGRAQAQSLPGTQALRPRGDLSAAMVAGIDKMALRLIEASKAQRKPEREKLKAILGVVDERVPPQGLALVGTTQAPALLAETESARLYRVRWTVLPGVHGEGIYIQPKAKALARVIYLPDADTEPEELANDALLSASGCEVLIPTLISRGYEYSANVRFGVKTNIPHREWIYRQAYELGRHVIGYEVQKVLAAVDGFEMQPEKLPLLVAGLGEGGLVALYSAAVDPRIHSVYVSGCFAPREDVWAQPLYRHVFGLLRDFGDAEVASLIAPRKLVVHHFGFPQVSDSRTVQDGVRDVAAPGKLLIPSFAAVQAEVARARARIPGAWIQLCTEAHGLKEVVSHLLPSDVAARVVANMTPVLQQKHEPRLPVDVTRQERQVRELESYTQNLLFTTERERRERFWKKLPLKSLPDYEALMEAERERFWREVIGKLPEPNVPANACSRVLYETEKVVVHEWTLEVWQDVFAWGWLALPKDLKPEERRPVVVCQHGLEGLPEDVFQADPKSKAYGAYQAFALRLAEQGFITVAPHNPYRGKDAFRTLQRKLNPLGFTLYSVINGQHQRLLEWLQSLPFTQAEQVAFYGLSYGGKSAMRTPAVLPGYCLSICSGDFNEWVRKCVSTELPMSYLHTHEYEIWEWNLGRTFNYAEMAALIAPRPFMVERGHDDGVGLDEWVDYEYAKVRRLYDKLGLGEQTRIEHFNGPHMIHGVGTFDFLREKLSWPKPN